MLVTHGPTLPTWALQQVVGYVRHTGRDANVVAKAARDSKQSWAWEPSCKHESHNSLARGLFDHHVNARK
jgi:hypothetical protein